MKVGIITFHQAANYGAVLQAYALNKVIASLGYDCEIINYHNDVLENNYKLITLKDCKNLRQIISALIYGGIRNRKLRYFFEFTTQYCILSDEYYTRESIYEASGKYDLIIAGSDQVWNLGLTGNDYHYFLDFAHESTRKCSYAASISGIAYNESQRDIIIPLLKEYAHISMREIDGKDYVDSLNVEKEITVDLDPTLLLTKDEWHKISVENPIKKKIPSEFLLVYFVSPDEKYYEEARRIGREKRLPLVLINYTHKKVKGFLNLRCVSPGQFVNLIEQASFIVTNSFHGTAFSINLQKEFVYVLNGKKPEKNARIKTLVQEFDLKDRENKVVDINTKIQWDNICAKLDNVRKKSMTVLTRDILCNN